MPQSTATYSELTAARASQCRAAVSLCRAQKRAGSIARSGPGGGGADHAPAIGAATSAPDRMLKENPAGGVRGELVQSLAPIVRPASKLGGGQPRKAAVLLPIRESHTRLLARPMQPAGAMLGHLSALLRRIVLQMRRTWVGITCRATCRASHRSLHVPVLRKLWG